MERQEQQRFLREVVPGIYPLFARAMVMGNTVGKIDKLSDFIGIKAIMDRLPAINKLKDDQGLLLRLLR